MLFRSDHVFTLHAELEGMRLAPAFERLLEVAHVACEHVQDGVAHVQIGLAGRNTTAALALLGVTPPAIHQTVSVHGGQVIGIAADRYILALEVEAAISAVAASLPVPKDRKNERARNAVTGLISRGVLVCRGGWIWQS